MNSTSPAINQVFHPFSLSGIFLRFKWRTLFTFTLVFVEAILDLLYPLFIGWAINDLLNNSHQGLYYLAGLGVASIVIGGARRFYDTRIFSGIYQTITPEMIAREQTRETDVSTVSARAKLLSEFVEFLENTMPEVIKSLVGLVGVLIIIAGLNLNVFFACLGLLTLIIVIYLCTGHLNYRLNAGYNEELENQVRIIAEGYGSRISKHVKRLMKWNIKLSDLETVTFCIIWLAVLALFIYTPLSAINSDVVNYGLLVSLLMYVFDYIEKATSLPLFIQQLIRLKEISVRIR